jgi:tellurite methyltransferase
MNGGYDDGYQACPCFWGQQPGSLIRTLIDHIPDLRGVRILDAGCGEGKNAIYLARRGADVHAIDISERAMQNARAAWHDYEIVTWETADIRSVPITGPTYRVVLAYGLLHCFASAADVHATATKLQDLTSPGGYHVICAFNARLQDHLRAHPGFTPILLDHDWYVQLYRDWNMLHCSDKDLHEIHPHNGLPHTHSLTRILASKGPSR